MGRRGPPPEPTALKVLKGNPGRRPLNDCEPRSKLERPRCPTWLDKEAKSVWKKIVPKLEAMGVLTEIDGQALTRYCTAWAQWKRSIEFIQKRGDTFAIKDDKGEIRYLQQYPQVSIANKLATQLTRLEQEFGMTPSARTRIRIERSVELDEFERFLKADRA